MDSDCFKRNWNSYLLQLPSDCFDIYFMEEYVKLYENDVKQALAFVWEKEEKILIFPFLLEAIPGTSFYDFETAYGYGGPISNSDDKNFLSDAWNNFIDIARNKNILAGFIRLHPLLNNDEFLDSNFTIINDRNTIAINLEYTPTDIWQKEIHSKHRNVIRKASDSGLIFSLDENLDRIDQFVEVYNSTMKRIDADSFYFFSKDYYEKLKRNLSEHSFLGIVSRDSSILAMAIFFYSGSYGHYHLAGSYSESLKYYPNNLLLYKAALELKERGCKYLHLGGGLSSSPDDNLFKFKKRFSKKLWTFSIAKIIVNENEYKSLCSDWENKNPEKAKKFNHITLRYRL